jgi:hypothetical protein
MIKVSQRAESFEVERHGADFADYWQGAGTAQSGYDYIATGTGSTEYEAYQDALELLGQDRIDDVDSLELRIRISGEQFDDETTARDALDIDDQDELDSEPMFRVSIRYNVEDVPEDLDLGMIDGRRVWIDETRRTLAEMLTESTGTHFLDSGGAYGRHWQHNQAAVEVSAVEHPAQLFEKQPDSTVDFRYGIEQTHSLYHFLADRLEYNPALDAAFEDFASNREDTYWLQDAQDFVEEHLPQCGIEVSGLYGDGAPMVINTYNGPDLLSQVIQYVFWQDENGAHVALSIHGGCDVRGGYGRPRIFDINGQHDETAILCNADGAIGCSECEAYWRTDDAYHYYRDGACGCGAGTELQEYDRVELDDLDEDISPDDIPAQTELRGKLVIDPDGNGYCPDCGHKLVASPF